MWWQVVVGWASWKTLDTLWVRAPKLARAAMQRVAQRLLRRRAGWAFALLLTVLTLAAVSSVSGGKLPWKVAALGGLMIASVRWRDRLLRTAWRLGYGRGLGEARTV